MPVTFRPLSRCSGPAVMAGLIGPLPTAALAAPDWHVAPESPLGTAGAVMLLVLMGLTVLLLAGHAVRHGRLTLARLFGAMCLTSRFMDAAEAERSGLVARVIAADKLLEEALAAAAVIAGFSLPVVMMIKESVNRAYESALQEGLLFERRTFHSAFVLDDQKEGMAAFVEKRKPAFRNR